MELDFALIADRAEVGQSGLLHLFGGCIDIVRSPIVPFFAQFYVVARFKGEMSEHGSQHMISLSATRPSGEKKPVAAGTQMALGNEKVSDPESNPGMIVLLQIYASFPEFGKYLLHLEADGVEVRTLYLVARPAPEGDTIHGQVQ
jgi:hypothetical protein